MAAVGGLDEDHPIDKRSLLGAQRLEDILRQLKLFDRKQQVLDIISALRDSYVERFGQGVRP
jgi:hypothetical protein